LKTRRLAKEEKVTAAKDRNAPKRKLQVQAAQEASVKEPSICILWNKGGQQEKDKRGTKGRTRQIFTAEETSMGEDRRG